MSCHGLSPVGQQRAQRGAALLLAMLILSLVATLAAAMVWQQWRAVQVESAERARTQATWILAGALDWARLILREDGRSAAVDHLGEPWAVPLAEARLSSFLAADREVASDDGPEAFLSGAIVDAQARFNLNNLINGGLVVPAQYEAFKRLLDTVGVSSAVAETVTLALRDAGAGQAASGPSSGGSAPSGLDAVPRNPNPPLQPRRMDQLRWLGLDADTLGRLQGLVDLLPPGGTVNLNTAPREVLAAVIDKLDLAGAQRLIQARERNPFKRIDDANAVLGAGFDLSSNPLVGINSNLFEVRGRLRIGDRVLEERSLVQRKGADVIVLSRERVNRNEAGP